MTTQQQESQNPVFCRCMVSCPNLNTTDHISMFRMETGDLHITEVPPRVTVFATTFLET